jgi:multidrug efflux pump subunit AcrA (membrane-fusion protein)
VAPVEALFASGDRVVVRSPMLKPGMTVLVEGNERVFPGQPLKFMDTTAAPTDETPASPSESEGH